MTKQQFIAYLKSRVTRYSKAYKLNTGKAFAMWYAVEGLEIDEVVRRSKPFPTMAQTTRTLIFSTSTRKQSECS